MFRCFPDSCQSFFALCHFIPQVDAINIFLIYKYIQIYRYNINKYINNIDNNIVIKYIKLSKYINKIF